MTPQAYERKRERELGKHRAGRARQLQPQAKDPRVWNREEYVRLEQDSFIVFVDRLPGDISKELFQLFSWTGRINDIYLSRKMRNGDVYLFAFIRYTTNGRALKAISKMNSMRLRGKEIFVREAKYKRYLQGKDCGRHQRYKEKGGGW
ncbi:uncharacterized protein LOC127741504 [Arachis duranensis]|uniref:Uncharacterized protein LOC127741504 n=1 Tax=Arachis duranensis TaxID=130453 RepID=A0A9C6WQ20_ARADU|nr:uncharacterized protein LOC127741504 [Arachis duranensis]